MNIEECYEEMGGNYAEVKKRFPSLGMIEKFIGKFLDDKSFETVCRETEQGNREEAFRAAHTLKGICANLSFSRLLQSTSRLTEVLRAQKESIPDEAVELLEAVRRDYEGTVNAIRKYLKK
ncbi:MAG: Hpt domain-containing protein [Christensenellales bacterium]